MKDRFNPTDKAILDATESMLHWGLPAEVILKAVEHLKGVRRLREMEMECKAAEIQAEVRKQAAEHQACGLSGCVAPAGHTAGCVTREVLEAMGREAHADRERALSHQASDCILPVGHTSPCIPSEHINAYQRAANAMSKPPAS